jgi:large subunit ribosomal protein L17
MRHLKGRRKLNRTTSHRIAMLRNMVTSLLRHEQITTTDVKAKELRRVVERVITLSKRVPEESAAAGNAELSAARVHAIRMARRWVNDRDVLRRLFTEYGTRYSAREGGYTRIVKLGFRAGDNAPMCLIQLMPADA